ncbi:FtsQ-type POTRA domain-containing protein [Pelagibacteraceae bacterium]|nr:FtsQ-type POTRA domain-containing protein [Pelagibacteraceae bacterium]
MKNINRRRYVLSFRSFTYFFILLFLIIFSFLLYFNKNILIETSKNIIQSFSENFQYQFTKFNISGVEKIELKFVEDKLQKYIGSSIFLLPLDQINDSIKENHWVKEIYLNTNYKDTLFVRIEEHKPIGIYFFNEQYFVFDENGKIIDQIYVTDFIHQSLLIFKGNSSNLKANSLINTLKNNDFEKKYQIESLEFINKRRWDINLYSDVKLMLSEEDPNTSIQNFIIIQNKLSETEINNIKTYDLRNLKKTILINLND